MNEFLEHFSEDSKCIEFMEYVRWDGQVVCAHCNHTKCYFISTQKRYKCAYCKKQFNVLKGTIFENSKVPLKDWFAAIFLHITDKKGLSSPLLATYINVTLKTSWFMLQRIRYMLRDKKLTSKLAGVTMLDETLVGGKNKNRHPNKKVKNSQGRACIDKTPILGMINNGKLYTFVMRDTSSESIKPRIYQMIERGSIIITDDWTAYNNLGGNYEHYRVDHSKKEYMNEQGFTTNPVEGAWSHLKRRVIGRNHTLSRKHLHRYGDDFSFSFNTRKMSTMERFIAAFTNIERRLTYKQLVGSREFSCWRNFAA